MKEKIEELTIDLEIIKQEISDSGLEGVASSAEVKQLEQQKLASQGGTHAVRTRTLLYLKQRVERVCIQLYVYVCVPAQTAGPVCTGQGGAPASGEGPGEGTLGAQASSGDQGQAAD